MKYLIRHTLLIVLALCCINCMYAQYVTETDAIRIAKVFYGDVSEKDNNSCNKESLADYKLTSLGGDTPTMYKINTPQGWVIVSADQRVRPILAYSDSPNMTDDTTLIYNNVLLGWYNEQIAYIRDSSTNEETHPEWLHLQSSSMIANRDVIVSPLLVRNSHAIAWRQAGNQNGGAADCDKTYNKYFPVGNNGDNICHKYVVGCGSLSAAEVMWYWQWPKSAMAKDENGNYFYRKYNWSNIPYVLSNSSSLTDANMTANLLHDVAIADNAEFLPDGTSTVMIDVLSALNTCFGYDGTIVYRNDYNNTSWYNLLKNELDNDRPILYGGCFTLYHWPSSPIISNDCHQFVIDGYASNNYFHVVYSQQDNPDDYYTLDLKNDNSGMNVYYNGNHQAIIGIEPLKFCSPVEINTNQSWPDWFNKVYVGGVTISNKVIPATSKGVITSRQYVVLGPGFTIQQGATVTIDIDNDLSCGEFSNGVNVSRRNVISKYRIQCEEDFSSRLKLFPNPATDILNIQSEDELLRVDIYNLDGQCVLHASQADIDVSGLPHGMYIVRATTTANELLQTKFIKQ